MAAADRDVASAVLSYLSRVKKRDGVDVDAVLYGEEGVGLDSLDIAELSAVLEDDFGSDPFSAGLMPETINEIAAFYDAKPTADA